ncbi:winged helix-turn-helix domain-containing protein [Streptomyces sp. NPDC058297]|uniref:winged helix-turn-helix domain-containing protein n=1 Tax=Streptomyces sp. NPDC058297 TaxID=3346433 RepID=UPI0036DFDDA3
MLRLLRQDGRCTNRYLAQKLGIAPSGAARSGPWTAASGTYASALTGTRRAVMVRRTVGGSVTGPDLSGSSKRRLTGKNPVQAPLLGPLEEAELLRRVAHQQVLRLLVVHVRPGS